MTMLIVLEFKTSCQKHMMKTIESPTILHPVSSLPTLIWERVWQKHVHDKTTTDITNSFTEILEPLEELNAMKMRNSNICIVSLSFLSPR